MLLKRLYIERVKMRKRKAEKKEKVEGFEEKQKRLERNRKARASHWRKTGVGDATINWMREGGWL